MRRSRVLDGREQQRSRAKLRKRLDRPRDDTDATSEAVDELLRRLRQRYSTSISVEELERADLDEFLAWSADIDLPSTERLRQLAVHLEEVAVGEQPRGWLALKRIYELGLRLCDDDDERWELLRSTAISADHFAFGMGESEKETRTRKRLFGDAYTTAMRLREIDSECAGSYSLLAQIRYHDPDSSLEEVLEEADLALERDPKHFWALLHRAWCLRDLKRWREAVEAYSRLNPADFTGHRARRYEYLLESRAHCLLQDGQR